ncbi:IS110 family transposase [Streptomyces sp. NPDC057717]|uniref:IS110 family transposase n=1 Tax=unclassified Streptomyces TaxID=2593676 RepID=UPI003696E36C
MSQPIEVIGGIDTHTDVHQAAVIDTIGRHLGTKGFPTTPAGYRDLLEWLHSHGRVLVVGMEGTGSFGAELGRHLRANQIAVIEVDRPDRRARRASGKSDSIDAYAAATAVLAGRATGTPKNRDGAVEAIRGLRVVRASAVKSRTQTINQIKSLIITAPAAVREALRSLATPELVRRLAASRPGAELADPGTAVKIALKRLAKRFLHLSEEIADADADLRVLISRTAPGLLALLGVGTETAGQLLVTAGDNPDRLASEASFAHLCAAAPVPASSGRTDRHRLNRGGDRQANRALHTIVLVRMRHDPRTRNYVARRTLEGLKTKDIFRCLKRFVAREVYRHLTSGFSDAIRPSPTA